MTFDAAHIITGCLFGALGFIYFSYGRKQGLLPLCLSGFALMAFPYFIDSIPWMIGVGVVLAGVPWLFR